MRVAVVLPEKIVAVTGRENEGVGLGEKHQRVVDHRVVAALEVVVAEREVAVMSTPRTSRLPCALMFESTTASITGRGRRPD
jgi:hypothetical protein